MQKRVLTGEKNEEKGKIVGFILFCFVCFVCFCFVLPFIFPRDRVIKILLLVHRNCCICGGIFLSVSDDIGTGRAVKN